MFQNLVFVALFLLSLFGNVPESKADAPLASGKQSRLESGRHNGPFHDVGFPLDSKGNLPGEAPNENDTEKETDDEDAKEFWHRCISHKTVASNSVERSALHSPQLFQIYQCVSLFILYHSWKSYLS